MKKSIWTVLFAVLITLLTAGCDMQAELSVLQGKVDQLDKRVSTLEDAVAKINTETIPSLQNLVNALNKKLTIVSIVEGDGEYTITFSDGTTAVIRDGKDGIDGIDGIDGVDGVDGNDGETPVISIALDEDGIYYWTVNGAWLLDNDGNKVPVTSQGPQGEQGPEGPEGPEGPQGVTPLFGTSSEHKLIVSYDNGETWHPVGLSIIDGSAFTSAYIDEEKSTEDYIVLVVGETEVQIPREKTFALKIDYDGDLNSVGINGGNTLALPFYVEGVSAEDDVTVDVLSATAGLNARIAGSFILITADEDVNSGKVFVFADNNKGKTNIKVIRLEEGVIEAIADVTAQVSAEGGEIALTVNTNKQYNVFVSEGDEDWLSVHEPDSKAIRTDNLLIEVAPNTTGGYREGSVCVTDDATAETIQEFVILQQPNDQVATEIASVCNLPDNSAAFIKEGIVVAATKSSAMLGDGEACIYVTPATGLVVGDMINISGIKKTDETAGFTYLEIASEIELISSGNEVPDLDLTYYGMASANDASGSLHTSFVANIAKDETGNVVLVPYYEQQFVVVDPLDALNLAEFTDGDAVVVDGYTNGGLATGDVQIFNYVLRSIKKLTYQANPDWSLAWDESTKSLVNTVTGESEEWYQMFIVPASYIGPDGYYPTVEDLMKVAFVYYQDDVQYCILGEWAGYPAWMIIQYILDDAVKQGSGSMEFDLPYGDFIAFAYGMEDETFNLTGNYAMVEFTREDPRVAASYEDFLGTWMADTQEWTVAEADNGHVYAISGPLGNNTLYAYYEDGAMVVKEYDIAEAVSTSYGTAENVVLGGGFTSGSRNYWGYRGLCDEPSTIFTIYKCKDGSFEVSKGGCPVTYDDGTTSEIPFTYFCIWGLLGEDAGAYAGYTITFSDKVTIPSYFGVPVQDEAEYFFKEDFEDPTTLSGWSLFDADGDGHNWDYDNGENLAAHSGTGKLYSKSYDNDEGALTPDNWVFTPGIQLAAADNYLSFWVCPQDASYAQEHYAAYVTTTAPDEIESLEAECTKIAEGTLTKGYSTSAVAPMAAGTWEHVVAKIPDSFNGKKVYLAVRHFNCTDWFYINLDDVAVSVGKPATTAAISNVAAQPSTKIGQKVFVGSEKAKRSLKTSDISPATHAANRSLKASKAKGEVTNAAKRK